MLFIACVHSSQCTKRACAAVSNHENSKPYRPSRPRTTAFSGGNLWILLTLCLHSLGVHSAPEALAKNPLISVKKNAAAMKDKREPPTRESNRRAPKAAHEYDEKMLRRKSKAAGTQDDRDRDGPLPRHGSIAIRPRDRERDRDSIYSSQRRSGHASKLMSSEEAQKAIRNLFQQVKETLAFFARFSEEYQREVRGIEAYAGENILDKLWERRIKIYDSKSRSSKGRSKDDDAGVRSEFNDVSSRLWNSLHDANEGARSHPFSLDDSIARKLETAISEVGKLLSSVQKKFQGIDALIKELKVLKVVLELSGAGTASHDDRANQQPRAYGVSHGHLGDSDQEREDERYGGVGEDSGSEDHGRRDEQHGGHSERSGAREEREIGDDEEGQGSFFTDQWVLPQTNVYQALMVVIAGRCRLYLGSISWSPLGLFVQFPIPGHSSVVLAVLFNQLRIDYPRNVVRSLLVFDTVTSSPTAITCSPATPFENP